TKGQLMKSLHTAFSFAPPSILSLTIFSILQTEIFLCSCSILQPQCGQYSSLFIGTTLNDLPQNGH
ncbi:hypothetical protein, partial [Blautia wexlerae]|uniref:hypothetical protein n=1 Tax=Blautia wexlerae TaxID=418240 RepID=UPI0032C1ED65